MRVLEYGKANPKTMLFLPCTAEPEWTFTASVTLLAQDYHVLQIVYDGHGIFSLDAAYGCSLGGACLTRFLAMGEVKVEQAIIDGGITPYQMPALLCRLACLRDFWGFKLLAGSRKLLEAAYPPEKYTLPGHDPVKEYDAMEQSLKSYSSRTIRNIFWSANNFSLPEKPAQAPCRLVYWYGEAEKNARRENIRFIEQYFPQVRTVCVPGMEHAELVLIHPQEFYRRVTEYLASAPRSESPNPAP